MVGDILADMPRPTGRRMPPRIAEADARATRTATTARARPLPGPGAHRRGQARGRHRARDRALRLEQPAHGGAAAGRRHGGLAAPRRRRGRAPGDPPSGNAGRLLLHAPGAAAQPAAPPDDCRLAGVRADGQRVRGGGRAAPPGAAPPTRSRPACSPCSRCCWRRCSMGFRHAVRVPAELAANWAVQVAWSRRHAPARRRREGRRSAALRRRAGAGAAAALRCAVHAARRGGDRAVRPRRRPGHARGACSSATARCRSRAATCRPTSRRWRRSPSSRSSSSPTSSRTASGSALQPAPRSTFAASLAVVFLVLRAVDAVKRRTVRPFEFDEMPEPPTQRLGLSCNRLAAGAAERGGVGESWPQGAADLARRPTSV